MLRDKGLAEYAEASRLLRARWPQAEVAILGFAGSDNRSAVPIAEIERWQDEGIVTYLGDTDDVRPFLDDSDCVAALLPRRAAPDAARSSGDGRADDRNRRSRLP